LPYTTNFLIEPAVKNGAGYGHIDELDLISLIQRVISFINRFKIVLIGCISFGLTCGLCFYFSSPKQFSTRLIVRPWFLNQSGLLSNPEEIEIIENWKNLLAKGEKRQLAALMNCQEYVIQKLTKISAEEILRTYVPNNPNGFLINVAVTDTSILDQLQKGIVYGLNNSPFVKEKIAIRRTKDIQLMAKTNEEIAKLNNTKNMIDSLMKTRITTSASLLIDISRINGEWIDLNEKLMGYQEDLKFLSGVQVLENFTKGNLKRTSLLKFCFLGIAAGCFIGYIICLFLYVIQRIKTQRTVMVAAS